MNSYCHLHYPDAPAERRLGNCAEALHRLEGFLDVLRESFESTATCYDTSLNACLFVYDFVQEEVKSIRREVEEVREGIR